jgi:hypothetical protein
MVTFLEDDAETETREPAARKLNGAFKPRGAHANRRDPTSGGP